MKNEASLKAGREAPHAHVPAKHTAAEVAIKNSSLYNAVNIILTIHYF